MADRSFSEQLRRESDAWVAEGLLTAEQAEAIRGRYAGAAEPRGRATEALAVIGAVAVGLGVIGFVAANWEELSHALRLLLLTVAVAGAYAAGFQLRDRSATMPRVGEALYLLGVVLFGASLFLVGQMYHVEAHDPLALLLWAGGATATALVVRSRAIAAAAVLILTAWVGFELGVALDDEDDALAALPVVAALYGGALYGLGTAAERRLRGPRLGATGFPEAGRWIGLPIAALGLFVFTFSDAAGELGDAGAELDGGLLAWFVVLTAIALAGAAALAVSGRPSGPSEGGVLALAVVLLLLGLTVGGSGTLYALAFNAVFAVLAIGAIYTGYLNDERWLVNLGVLLVAVDLVARYFDVFWDALPRSLGLIGAGLLVLGIAYVLERQRKRLLERMAAA